MPEHHLNRARWANFSILHFSVKALQGSLPLLVNGTKGGL
jgi:hypothetical protein